ncbi:MAG: hypothetical protein BWZ06_01911 [Bacteroidetes bacterium ADurb.BinA261]|nr:MAG: hypothetical protein BWZ06_01911 [Bacteroidetes bacterium ADurb.BinA261]
MFRNQIENFHQMKEILFRIDVFLPVCRNHKIFFLFKSQLLQNRGFLNFRQVMHQYLIHRTARFDDPVSWQSFPQQVFPRNRAVSKIDIRNMIHYFAVAFFGNTLVETPVTRFHVKNGNVPLLGCNGAKARVGIAQDQKGVGLFFFQYRIYVDENLSGRFGRILSCCIQKVVRFANPQVVVKYFIEFVIVVLPRMHSHVLNGFRFVELGHNTRKTNDFRACSYDCEYFNAFYC